MSLEIGISPFFCFLLTSDARYFVVETKGNCDLDIGLLANSAFFLQVRCQKLTSLTTPEMIKKQLISLQRQFPLNYQIFFLYEKTTYLPKGNR